MSQLEVLQLPIAGVGSKRHQAVTIDINRSGAGPRGGAVPCGGPRASLPASLQGSAGGELCNISTIVAVEGRDHTHSGTCW